MNRKPIFCIKVIAQITYAYIISTLIFLLKLNLHKTQKQCETPKSHILPGLVCTYVLVKEEYLILFYKIFFGLLNFLTVITVIYLLFLFI